MARFGLIGRNIDYSFSRTYFREKFEREKLSHTYENFDLPNEKELSALLTSNPDVRGFNVTIPYKQAVLNLLDELDEHASQIKAVNTIKRLPNGKLKGFNTDHIGFEKALLPYLPLSKEKALLLGSGGASKAVVYALKRLDIEVEQVSRSTKADLTYTDLSPDSIRDYGLIVNCTPLGTQPQVELYPSLPYDGLGPQQLLFDLIYNPPKTRFMALGEEKGCRVINGYSMLIAQAEASWAIWNS